MPLTDIQAEITALLAPNRTPDSYLAGGAALHIEPNSSRYSNDLDYFHDSEERVASAYAEDRATLLGAGFSLDIVMQQPGFIRAVVRRGPGSTKVEWAHDTAWRFLPPIKRATAGYQLHPIDLAVNKILALVGRDEPRDFLDVMEIHRELLPLGALCWAGAGKDPGFTPLSLLSLLRRRGRYQPEDFMRLNLRRQPNLVALKTEWLAALADAEAFIQTLPHDEVGCLYYSPENNTFVGTWRDRRDVTPHFGRPGGILPKLESS